VVFPRVNLFHQAAYTGLIGAHQNKQIFSVKSRSFIFIDDLDVGQPLTIRADLVLAFDNQYAVIFERAISFGSGFEIKISNRSVPFGFSRYFVPVAVVPAKRRVCAAASFMSGFAPEEPLHIRRVENYCVERVVFVRQGAAINAR
jgi:hypothetical protein